MAMPNWVLWRWEEKKDGSGKTKVPYRAKQPDVKASSTNPATWSSFDVAVAAEHLADGIGFMLLGSGFAAFDIDDCRNAETGTIHPWGMKLVVRAASYTEITVSGTGLRIIGYGSGEKVHRKQQVGADGIGCESFRDAERFIVMTGNVLSDAPLTLANIDAVMDEVVAELDGAARKHNGRGTADGADTNELPTAAAALLHLKDHGPYGSCSQSMFAFISHALRARVANATIVAACLDTAHAGCGIFEHVQNNGGRAYIERQVERASKKTEQQGFAVNPNTGTPIRNHQGNIRHALELLEIKLSYDTFHDRLLVSGLPGHTLLDDPTLDKIWLTIDERFKFRATAEFFRVVVNNAARRNAFHPVRDYLDGLKWDGVQRLDRWLLKYAGAQDTEFIRAVGAITLIAAVRRVRKPGCKFDEMLILESAQGKDKSEMLKALAIQENWFSDDVPLNADGKKVIEQLMGKWIVEAAELSGMRKADVEHLKALLSRQVDRGRMAYGRATTEQPRQSIIIGTTNSPKYLKDLTGNRRFWPVKVANVDLTALKRDRDQLWAEAASREKAGASIRLASSLWNVAAVEQTERTVQDPWHELLADVLGDLQGKLAAADVWRIVGVDPGHRIQEHNARLGQAMKDLGFEPKSLNIDGKKQRAYARGTKEEKELQHIFVVVGEDGAFAGHTMDAVNAKKTAAREGKHI
jgi:hypothetical protein